jgi:carbamoyl-phosphate synthase large subunit
MRSTGEVMGIDATFGLAFAKSQAAAGDRLPERGTVFLSLADPDKPGGLLAARRFVELGFALAATDGTARYLRDNGVPVGEVVGKLGQGPSGPGSGVEGRSAVDLITNGEIDLVVNTPRGRGPRADGAYIRLAANVQGVPCLTTAAAALAAAGGIADWARHGLSVRSLQEFHEEGQQRLDL